MYVVVIGAPLAEVAFDWVRCTLGDPNDNQQTPMAQLGVGGGV